MKRFVLTFWLVFAAVSMASAQNYIIVSSEKVFKSLPEYTSAIEMLNSLGQSYEAQSTAKYEELENMYNNYAQVKSSLSAQQRQSFEEQILAKEKESNEFQQTVFGDNGTLMKKRIEALQPIQKRVFEALQIFAERNGAQMVMDSASNPYILYSNASLDYTDKFIQYLKTIK